MPIDRFYFDADLSSGSLILLGGAEHHHLAHVMRICVNEEIELINGRGQQAKGRVTAIAKHHSSVQILSSLFLPDSQPVLSLAIPLMRPSKLEWVVEKSTELGINELILYPADYSEKSELSSHQLERLRTLAISALKQSGRLHLPSFTIIAGVSSLFSREARILFGDPSGSDRIDRAISAEDAAILFISGPEKGFSSEELKLLSQHAKGVLLNSHVLRAETAPIAAASILGLVHIPRTFRFGE